MFKKGRSILAFVCIACLLMIGGCSKQPVSSDTSTPTTTYEYEFRSLPTPMYHEAAASFAKGSGTQADPYQISTAAELTLLSNMVNDRENGGEYRKAHYVLTADIALNEGKADTWETTSPTYSWYPIGLDYDTFEGVFDGANHTVSGIYINANNGENKDSKVTGYKYGLFGRVSGKIFDLNVTNSYICVSGVSCDVGSIAGQNGRASEESVIQNCTSDAILCSYDGNVGGLVGDNNATIEKCTFNGTVKQADKDTFSNIAGIAAQSGGTVKDCVNNGKITSGLCGVSYAAGIVAYILDGSVINCVNSGDVLCTSTAESTDATQNVDVSGFQAGGIFGIASSSNIGGDEYKNKDITISGCRNKGTVQGGSCASGIGAKVSQGSSDYPLIVTDCTNDGKVSCANLQAGIIGNVNANGAQLTISNCTNNVDFANGNGGGIIAEFTPKKGTVQIENCVNNGNITNEELYSGGIIRSMYVFGDIRAVMSIKGCVNKGKIVTPVSGGGIIGIINNTATLSLDENASLSITDCRNEGNIHTDSSNAFIGGIVGGLGVKNLKTTIANCINIGSLSVSDNSPQDGTVDSEKIMNLTRMCGGIVGRIGETLHLSTSYDDADPANINAEQAIIVLENCYSSGSFDVPPEDKYVNNEGKNIWDNEIGGIVGNCSGEEGYSFRVNNCGFTNVQRGLGTDQFNDVGKAMSAEEIASKIK